MKTYSLLRTKEKTDLSALMAWKPDTLAKFAHDLLRENEVLVEANEHLKADLRVAIDQYRNLITNIGETYAIRNETKTI
ncbi:hypothetical protein [Polaromonas sp.]|uniref:hypothetical protein n=1 Tax=Polaromonas sp. TaxID=1869339 RepID=UPI0035698822